MKPLIKFQHLCLACLVCLFLHSCYKYEKDISYAAINGTMIDKATNAPSAYAPYLQAAMTPVYITNGALIVDSNGHFTNTRIMPDTYKFYASGNNPYIYAFTLSTDTLSEVVLSAGKASDINIKVSLKPWIDVLASITSVTDTSITVSYTVKSNTSVIANEAAICWDTDPGKVNIKTPPLSGGNYNANLNWGNFKEPTPPNTNPQTNVDGTHSYTITGLTSKTQYYICAMARVPNGKTDPKGIVSNGNGDWWNASEIISATTN